jgi:hypothetical protein
MNNNNTKKRLHNDEKIKATKRARTILGENNENEEKSTFCPFDMLCDDFIGQIIGKVICCERDNNHWFNMYNISTDCSLDERYDNWRDHLSYIPKNKSNCGEMVSEKTLVEAFEEIRYENIQKVAFPEKNFKYVNVCLGASNPKKKKYYHQPDMVDYRFRIYAYDSEQHDVSIKTAKRRIIYDRETYTQNLRLIFPGKLMTIHELDESCFKNVFVCWLNLPQSIIMTRGVSKKWKVITDKIISSFFDSLFLSTLRIVDKFDQFTWNVRSSSISFLSEEEANKGRPKTILGSTLDVDLDQL